MVGPDCQILPAGMIYYETKTFVNEREISPYLPCYELWFPFLWATRELLKLLKHALYLYICFKLPTRSKYQWSFSLGFTVFYLVFPPYPGWSTCPRIVSWNGQGQPKVWPGQGVAWRGCRELGIIQQLSAGYSLQSIQGIGRYGFVNWRSIIVDLWGGENVD